MNLYGKIITLTPATLEQRQMIYEWCFHCETSKFHSGADFPNTEIPSYEDFCEDYVDYFFTDTEPNKGRGFIILHGNNPVGFISYSSYHLKPHKSELDIWMNSLNNCGKGFGTDAIITLGNYLNKELGIEELIMRPSIKNINAIKSYKKSGFEEINIPPTVYLLDEYVSLYGDGDYGVDETVLLIKRF
ncbi:MAG: GNAT family N-acetyltransferase [Firmicutes bacterium]|nr:GNAT family N-acetyltransferase [Bacillota bacterium]